MQAIRAFRRCPDRSAWLRAAWPAAALRVAASLELAIRRPPVGALLLQNLLT